MIAVCFFHETQAQEVSIVDTAQLRNEIERLLDKSKALKREGNYDVSYIKLDSAVTLSKTIDNEELISLTLSELGVICMYQGRYSNALQFIHEGLMIREALNDSAGLSESYNYVASVHHAQTDYDIAINYYNRSLTILKGLNDSKSLGILYNNLGSLYADKTEYEKALEYHNKSMGIWQEMNDTSWIAISLGHIGICYQKQGRSDEALTVFMRSYEMNLNGGSRMNVIRSCMPIGNLYLELGKPKEARKWCEEAYALSVEGSNLYGIKESCWCLSDVYEGMGRYDDALEFYKRSLVARDSIFGHERTKELTRLEMQFVFERQQLADSLVFVKQQVVQERRIERQRIGLVSIGGMLFLATALGFVVYSGKQKSEMLLLNILPKATATELKKTGKAESKHYDSVTILFTDFKGFTSLSEQLSPKDLVRDLDECFSEFDRICVKYGIEKIKTIGDAYMAAGGLPTPTTTHARDVVNAALEMTSVVEKVKARKIKQGVPFFEIRVGVHTGPVVAGIVGIKKFQYDIWGDAVNTASRMESSGEVGKVNISQFTYELLKDDAGLSFQSRGKIHAKGKGELEMYFVDRKA